MPGNLSKHLFLCGRISRMSFLFDLKTAGDECVTANKLLH